MNQLSRNQSADLIEHIVGAIIARAPESTQAIIARGLTVYLAENFEIEGIHEDHFGWLVSRLLMPGALSLIDDFAAEIRALGEGVDSPWRD